MVIKLDGSERGRRGKAEIDLVLGEDAGHGERKGRVVATTRARADGNGGEREGYGPGSGLLPSDRGGQALLLHVDVIRAQKARAKKVLELDRKT